jgi:hypothetical protein
MAGVLHFRSTDNQATITVDKKELKEKTDKAVEKTEAVGSEILDKTGQILHKAAAGLRESAPDQHAPAATPAPDDHNTRQPDANQTPAKN